MALIAASRRMALPTASVKCATEALGILAPGATAAVAESASAAATGLAVATAVQVAAETAGVAEEEAATEFIGRRRCCGAPQSAGKIARFRRGRGPRRRSVMRSETGALPPHAGEPGEVAVERDDGGVVLERQRSEVGVGNEVAGSTGSAQQFGDPREVKCICNWDDDVGSFHPHPDGLHCKLGGNDEVIDPGITRKAKKRQKASTRKVSGLPRV